MKRIVKFVFLILLAQSVYATLGKELDECGVNKGMPLTSLENKGTPLSPAEVNEIIKQNEDIITVVNKTGKDIPSGFYLSVTGTDIRTTEKEQPNVKVYREHDDTLHDLIVSHLSNQTPVHFNIAPDEGVIFKKNLLFDWYVNSSDMSHIMSITGVYQDNESLEKLLAEVHLLEQAGKTQEARALKEKKGKGLIKNLFQLTTSHLRSVVVLLPEDKVKIFPPKAFDHILYKPI